MRVLIDPGTDDSILYSEAFAKIGLLSIMHNPPHRVDNSYVNNLASVLGTIPYLVKMGNKDDGCAWTKETFYVIDAPY